MIKNISLPFKLLKSFFQVSNIFKSFKPTAVIGVGGYSSFPVLRYAQAKGVDTFIHESNSYAGKSNRMLGKNATKIFVAIDGMGKFFPSNKIIQTGNPVREAIVNSKLSREEAIIFFGLDPNKKTVLAIGGSLGAKNINEALAKDISEFEKNDLQLIWQTGKPFVEKGREIANGKSNIWVNDFITQMENAYGAADIVVSRSGAMSIAELAVMKKPAVLVPFPFAAEDHQTVNAQRLVDKNAAMMIPDSAALDQLVSTVVELSKNEKKQQALKENISELAVNNADEVIAQEILNALNKRSQ